MITKAVITPTEDNKTSFRPTYITTYSLHVGAYLSSSQKARYIGPMSFGQTLI